MSDRLRDAVFNRLREGLRVLEDRCRFIADDAELVSRLKSFRHDCAALERAVLGRRRLRARQVGNDHGRRLPTPQPSRRRHDHDVSGASWSRVQEALRSLEEDLKLTSPAQARRLEALRFRAYDLQAFAERSRARQWPLYALITESLATHTLDDLVPRLLKGGVTAIQLREKSLDDRRLLARARRLKRLVNGAPVSLILNDRPDLAVAAGFDGVHVGQSDLSPKTIKDLFGSRLFVGLSTHSVKQARAAAGLGADYIGIGPVFATQTKPHLKFLGTSLAKKMIRAADDLPHVCIGGVSPGNVAQLARVGARGVALCTGLIAVARPETAARRVRKALNA